MVLVVIRVLMFVEAARRMIVGRFLAGMAVRETMGVVVFVLVKMVVRDFAVPMGMGMQVAMDMVVFMFMLQGMDGLAAALPECIGQAVEIAQALILEKSAGRHILQNAPLMHHQGAPG